MSGPMRKNIGVIGLGIIGRGVTANLRQKGFQVFVWNRTPRPVPNFVGSPAELAEMCDYLQIFVSDDDALVQTVQQLSGALAPRHVVIAHSTERRGPVLRDGRISATQTTEQQQLKAKQAGERLEFD